MEPPSKVPGSQLVWVQKHLHFELLKEENYLEVFATVSERALLKVRPLVAIVALPLACPSLVPECSYV